MRGLARPDMDATPERLIQSLDDRKAENGTVIAMSVWVISDLGGMSV
jgi:hypothetical protein